MVRKNDLDTSVAVKWGGKDCGCSHKDELDGDVIGIYPFWYANDLKWVDFEGITRLAYYGLKIDDKGKLFMPFGNLALPYLEKNKNYEFVNNAHRHFVKLDESWRECSRLLTIFSQSLEVKRVSGFEDGSILEHCKPQTIKELSTSISGLSSVYQFEESFGGKARESDHKMRARVAESLYHKNRSVCIEDYERMILEAFPEVHKVKCFPHVKMNEISKRYDFMCPGYILVVPVSSLYCDGSFQWDPCLNGSVLRDIREFLQKKVTGLSKIRVINPFFDKLQVRCNVKLRSRGDALRYIWR